MTDERRVQPDTLKGISGWLAAFLFLLSAVLPIRALSRVVTLFSPETGVLFPGEGKLVLLTSAAVDLLAVIGCVTAAALMLLRRKWGSVRATIVVMAVLVVLDVLSMLWSLSWSMENAPSLVVLTIISTLLRMPLFAAIWTAYLLRSKRVANTYYRPGWVEAAAFA